MSFLEEIRQLTREANAEKDEAITDKAQFKTPTMLNDAIKDMDDYIRDTASEGLTAVSVTNGDFLIKYECNDAEIDTLVELIAKHYQELGLEAKKNEYGLDISWEAEEEDDDDEQILGEGLTFYEIVDAITTDAIEEQEADRIATAKKKEEANKLKLPSVIKKFCDELDEAVINKAAQGKTYLHVDFNNGYGSSYSLSGDYDTEEKMFIVASIVKHYSELGFVCREGNCELSIVWSCRQERINRLKLRDKAKKEATARYMQIEDQIADVQSARILSSFINREDYVMHTVRLTHQDGHKSILSIKENDPFFQRLVDKLEN